MMVPSANDASLADVRAFLFDLDGTVTRDGRVPASSLAAMELLQSAGILTLAVTGRPAGWCDLIARWWPVDAVIGENGAFCFAREAGGHIARDWFCDLSDTRREQLEGLARTSLALADNLAPAVDNDWRACDIAVDFAEEVAGASLADAERVRLHFEQAGAMAKTSSIHVNAWFGDHDKKTTACRVLTERFGLAADTLTRHVAYIGDAPNDEPMFAAFPISFGVAGVRRFLPQMTAHPAEIATGDEAQGFAEIAGRLLAARKAAPAC
ncbi:HAD-IIB family hydrolase [Maricaulis sp.]|uniref:HAD-IIB family hydrolase n=1 Tax=Maricaulis sp. TaxID=1486257 RepID=UPI0026079775|nr:HAD-IIB family hydrolase [Maricaulis sp.]MDF1769163.1 HAD-IIB family hydrolase [Maricaulis sp.]